MTENRIWYFGTALVAVAVLALGWLLGVSPKLDEAAAAESERSAVETQNLAIRADLRRLSAQYDDLSDMRESLTDLRKALPPEAETPSFLAELGDLRTAAPVTLTSVSVGDALPYVPSTAAGSAAESDAAAADSSDSTAEDSSAGADGAATGGTGTASAGTDGVDAAAAGPIASDPRVTQENLLLLPIEIEATGSRAELTTFLGSLQEGKRLYLVTDVSTELNTQPTDPGDYRSTISGYLYVLIPGDGSGATAESETTPTAALPAAPAVADNPAEVTNQ